MLNMLRAVPVLFALCHARKLLRTLLITVVCLAPVGGRAADQLRAGAIFSTAQAQSQSFLRFYNTGASAGTVTATLYDYDTGQARGQWTSPAIPAGAELQYDIGTVERGAGISGIRPNYYALSLQSGIVGYFQHVLFRPADGTLTNLSTCAAGVTADSGKLSGVHSSLLGDLGFPSSVVVTNTGAGAATVALSLYDARDGTKIGTYTTPSIPANGESVIPVTTMEQGIGRTPGAAMYHYVIKSEQPGTSLLQHLVTNTKAGVITDMTTACALDGAAGAAAASVLRSSAIFSTAQSASQSFLRFYNTGASAGAVTATLYDYTTGQVRGQWTSPSIPAGAELQYDIATVENGANVTGIKPNYYAVSLRSTITGYFQHVLFRPTDGTLTNLSTCGAGVTADPARLSGVHSSLVGSIGFPSSVVISNTASTATALTLGIYDARDGTKLGIYRTPVVQGNGGAVISVTDIEKGIGKSPTGTMYHYVIKSEEPFAGFLGHLVTNSNAGVTTDMTTGCALTSSTVFDAAAFNASAFEATAYVLPDAREYWGPLCNSPYLSIITPVDLNRDGRKDFVLHYWCNLDAFGAVTAAPTPDALVVYLAQPNGTYVIANQETFGTKFVKLGGASRKVAVGDLNGDGYPDLVYATNYEDGRSNNPVENSNAVPAIMLSSGNGSYTIEKPGLPEWTHSVDVVDNALGTADAVMRGFTRSQPQAFRWANGALSAVTDYPEVSASTFRFFPRESEGGESTVAVSDAGNGLPSDFLLFNKEGANWVQKDRLTNGGIDVPFLGWAGDLGSRKLVQIAGRSYVFPQFDESCTMQFAPGGKRFAVGKLSGRYVEGGYKEGVTYAENALPLESRLVFFDVSAGKLSILPSPIVNEKTDVNVMYYDCRDVNGDGYPDVVMHLAQSNQLEVRGQPLIYLNNKNGKLIRWDATGFPDTPRDVETHGFLSDLDGDGIEDLIYEQSFFTYTQIQSHTGSLPVWIFKGKKGLSLPN